MQRTLSETYRTISVTHAVHDPICAVAGDVGMKVVWSTAKVIIAKQSYGPTGEVRLHFNHEVTKCGDLAEV